MPSIWKKAKLGGLTRLVSDLRTSKQRRPDLPLQTGFPTSLADLVVKHRDRLKRAGKRRRKDRRAAEAAVHVDGSGTRSESGEISTLCEQSTPPSSSPSAGAGEDVGAETAEGDGMEMIQAEPDPPTDPLSSVAPDVCDSGSVELVVERKLSVCSAVFLIWVLAFGTKTVAFLATASVLALVLIRFLKARIWFSESGQNELRRSAESNEMKKIQESAREVTVTESPSQSSEIRSDELGSEINEGDDERKRSYVGCVIFILVALSGLVGGRIMALALTVVCCVAVKLLDNILHTKP